MSEERPVNRIFLGKTDTNPVQDHSEEVQKVIYTNTLQPEAAARIAAAERGELKAKIAGILDRSPLQDRFNIPLPADVYGEWAKNDPFEIARLQAIGFEVDTVYAPNRALHSDGAEGTAIVGDVIFMTAPMYVKELIDEVRHEEMIKRHSKKPNKQTKEEADFQSLTHKDTQGDIPTISESAMTPATVDSVREALQATVVQTAPVR